MNSMRFETSDGKQAMQGSAWPISTSVWCHHCCHPFSSMPLGLPVKYDAKKRAFAVTGVFCSWECMKAFNCFSGEHNHADCSMLICLLYKHITGGKMEHIGRAPPRWSLKVFGGPLTIEQFREQSKQFVTMTVAPRMIPHCSRLEKVPISALARKRDKHADNIKIQMRVASEIRDATTTNDPLQARRRLPIGAAPKKKKNTLLGSLGIVFKDSNV